MLRIFSCFLGFFAAAMLLASCGPQGYEFGNDPFKEFYKTELGKSVPPALRPFTGPQPQFKNFRKDVYDHRNGGLPP